MVKFNSTKEEYRLIHQIAKRAAIMALANNVNYPIGDIEMDLDAVNSNGYELDFEKLSKFDDGNFAHDIFGIRRHIDRETGGLKDFFIPRCSGAPKWIKQHGEYTRAVKS